MAAPERAPHRQVSLPHDRWQPSTSARAGRHVMKPAPRPQTSVLSRRQRMQSALQRLTEHARAHLRGQDWEALRATLGRMEAVTGRWREADTEAREVVAEWAESDLAALNGQLQELRHGLDAEAGQIRLVRRRLQAARGFQVGSIPAQRVRLDVSA